MKNIGIKTATAIGLALSVICYTAYKLLFIDPVTGFLECTPALYYVYYLVMAGASLFVLYKAYTIKLPDDPISGGSILSQLIVMWVGLMAIALSIVMIFEVISLMPQQDITLGSKISRIVGVPLSMIGGGALVYAGFDYTNLSTREKKASFALLGAAMQTYMLLYRFPDLLEVTTAPTQTLELFYLMSAALFLLFWARTLSGEVTPRQNRWTYMAGGTTAILGASYIAGELVAAFLLGDVLPMAELPVLDMLVMASVSVMAFNFVTGSGPRHAPRKGEVILPVSE